MKTTAQVVAAVGVPTAKRLLLLAETLGVAEGLACGFVTKVAEPAALDAEVASMCKRLAGHAPVTMRVSKEAIRRLTNAGLPDADDLIRAAYGSADLAGLCPIEGTVAEKRYARMYRC